jgi:hypothetical protein
MGGHVTRSVHLFIHKCNYNLIFELFQVELTQKFFLPSEERAEKVNTSFKSVVFWEVQYFLKLLSMNLMCMM